jgi:hypothetical protein
MATRHCQPMTSSDFRALALSLPRAEEKESWADSTLRVRGKIFAVLGPDGAAVYDAQAG